MTMLKELFKNNAFQLLSQKEYLCHYLTNHFVLSVLLPFYW